MPETLRVTVTSSSTAPDRVAVSVKGEPFSATDAAEDVRVRVGAVSFSLMVMVADWVPFSLASAPEVVSIEITAVSSPS